MSLCREEWEHLCELKWKLSEDNRYLQADIRQAKENTLQIQAENKILDRQLVCEERNKRRINDLEDEISGHRSNFLAFEKECAALENRIRMIRDKSEQLSQENEVFREKLSNLHRTHDTVEVAMNESCLQENHLRLQLAELRTQLAEQKDILIKSLLNQQDERVQELAYMTGANDELMETRRRLRSEASRITEPKRLNLTVSGVLATHAADQPEEHSRPLRKSLPTMPTLSLTPTTWPCDPEEAAPSPVQESIEDELQRLGLTNSPFIGCQPCQCDNGANAKSGVTVHTVASQTCLSDVSSDDLMGCSLELARAWPLGRYRFGRYVACIACGLVVAALAGSIRIKSYQWLSACTWHTWMEYRWDMVYGRSVAPSYW